MTDSADLTELRALTQSIGEHAVQAIGGDTLRGLRAEVEAQHLTCTVTVSLRDNSYEEQLRVLDVMVDVEELFLGDAIITVRFSEDIAPIAAASKTTVPTYSFA